MSHLNLLENLIELNFRLETKLFTILYNFMNIAITAQQVNMLSFSEVPLPQCPKLSI